AMVTDGEVHFMDRRYHVERAVVDFLNPVRIEPVLNVQASTTVRPYQINLSFVGPLARLRTQYTSDPPLPAVDIINLLAFGRITEANAGPSAPTGLGAQSLLAKAVANEVSSRAERLFGLSELKVDPLIGGNQRNPTARIAFQKRMTNNLTFTYATDVTSTQ